MHFFYFSELRKNLRNVICMLDCRKSDKENGSFVYYVHISSIVMNFNRMT